MRTRRIATLALLFLAMALAARKKNPDGLTQTLEFPKDPPMVATGATSRLIFQVSPLSGKGLLTQQTRDALKAILKANGGAQPVHIRAFVAGSGDPRRVPQIVSEVFGAKKMSLPSVSVVLVGALPLENAQVVVEAVSVGRKEVNPDGLTFLEGQSPDRLAGVSALRVTCFVGSMDNAGALAARFPSAAVDVIQPRRSPSGAATVCEAVGHGGDIKAPRLAFTGTRVAFGDDEKASALVFQHLDRALEAEGPTPPAIVETNVYALSDRHAAFPRTVTFIAVEGVESVDGRLAVDSVAAISR